MKMNTSKWKEFRVGDLFETIKDGKQVPTGSVISVRDLTEGDIPRVTVTDKNNGVIGCYAVDNDKFNVYENFLSVSFLGSVFYHSGKASLDMKVHCLKPLYIQLNAEIALFLSSVIKKYLDELDYTNQISSSMLPSMMIKLPATPDDYPDWNYMEQYMRSVMENCEKKYQTLVRISQEKHQVDTTAWGEFRVGDVFDIVPCKGVNSTLLEDGDDVPYIAASRVNNGFNRMVSAVNVESWISKGNCLQLIHIGDAAAGWVNYIQNDFIGMSGKSSCAYNERMNEYSGTFIASVLCARNEGQYSFKESWTGEKVVNTVIKLPITSSGEPDWDYMEQYMKRIMQRQSVVVEALRKIA